ncbi:hypothetical protein A5757_05365 [Mycobacterium sp. 852013-51886_SCH5428379]|nr:hypothetical protein A5757_05365 [Mycobacterium sp. 852013-51886_SCH5428379]
MARPTAIAMPSTPSHRPASAITTHSAVVTVGHGDTTANTGAKKNPVPMYQAEPVRSHAITNRNQRGIGCSFPLVCMSHSFVGDITTVSHHR